MGGFRNPRASARGRRQTGVRASVLAAHQAHWRRRATMSKGIWASGVLVLLLWSLAAWAIAFVFTTSADFVALQAQLWCRADPEVQLTISSISAALAHSGRGA